MATKHSDLMGGSSAERLIKCAGSVVLAKKAPRPRSSKYADEGSMKHDVMEQILQHGNEAGDMIGWTSYDHTLSSEDVGDAIIPALDALDRLVLELDDGDIEYQCEIEVRYKKYPDAFGTIDVLATTENHVIVLDWKFGSGVMVSAQGNYQGRFYAGAARDTKPELFKDRDIVIAIVQPAAGDPLDYEIINHADLDDFVDEVHAGIERLLAGDERLSSGKWCRWCPAEPVCTLKHDKVRSALEREADPTCDPDELGALYKLAQEAGDWAASVFKFVAQEMDKGRPVTGLKLVRGRAPNRKWRDEEEAKKALMRLQLPMEDIIKTSLITPTQAEKLVKSEGRHDPAVLQEMIVQPPNTSTTIAPEDDKKPGVNPVRQAPTISVNADASKWMKQ